MHKKNVVFKYIWFWIPHLMDFVHPLMVDKIDGFEVIVNEGELFAILGDGWEHAGYPE